jgi:DNA-binding transcriptional ArsR family regulator
MAAVNTGLDEASNLFDALAVNAELPDLDLDLDLGSHRALSHPARHRLLMALRDEPGTTSGLARRLGLAKGSVAHHLGVLVAAGMVRLGSTRPVRGGTEQYYEIAVGRIRGGNPEASAAMLAAVALAVATDPDPLLHLRHVRLSAGQVKRLSEALEAIVADAPDSDGGQLHGVLVGLYRVSR